MQFLINDIILDFEPATMLNPVDSGRFSELSVDYITQLGQEMFALDPLVHRNHAERVRRLCFLLHLKMPKTNAAQFFVTSTSGNPQDVHVQYKSLNEMVLNMMYQQQKAGQLNAQKVDDAVWQKLAA